MTLLKSDNLLMGINLTICKMSGQYPSYNWKVPLQNVGITIPGMNKVIPSKAEPKTAIGKRLRKARINAGFDSIMAFVLKHGFEYSAYNSHELGHRNPRLPTIKKYANALGVSWQWISDGKEEDLSEEEKAIIEKYRGFSDHQQKAFVNILDSVSDIRTPKKTETARSDLHADD